MSYLYNLFIGPLQLIFEFVFSLANMILDNPGLSIVFLSLAMNFLVLPLYKRADAMQLEQRNIELKLKPWVNHIKKTFKGDERFMMLQTYYRQNNYKPVNVLKGSVSLLLEIPFFIAAYKMLSGLQLLQGVEFGLIKDLALPDKMLTIGSIDINVLPILMTIINIISGVIYTKGMSKQSKIQLFGMAGIFLVLLYNSPAGVVFYWTLNNVFSLVKNIFYKIKNPKLVLGIVLSLGGIGFFVYSVFIHPANGIRKQILVTLLALILQIPIVSCLFKRKVKFDKAFSITKKDNLSFLLGCLYLSLLTGLLIPSSLVSDSPEEFINTLTFSNPLVYVLNSLMFSVGTFVIWFGVFYMLANNKGKKLMNLVVWIGSGVGTIDYMFFGLNYGNINSRLCFDVAPNANIKEQIINIAIVFLIAVILFVMWKYKNGITRIIYVAACFAIVGMSLYNANNINVVAKPKIEKLMVESNTKESPHFNINKNGKNVVVIMMDRAINCYIPYLFQEKPEVAKQFDGFTYYPNTITYGGHTNLGAPGLYGGYEYIPEEMNKRDSELLADKHNEALKVMPKMFLQQGYDVTVLDPSYAGYALNYDLSIYDDEPDIKAYNAMDFFDEYSDEAKEVNEKKLRRNFFSYSLFKISPVVMHRMMYTNGAYNNPDDVYFSEHSVKTGDINMVHNPTSISTSTGLAERFMRAYNELDNMPEMTNVSDNNKNTFLMMSNDTSHEPMLLQTPDYIPSSVVDNREYDAQHSDRFNYNGEMLQSDKIVQMTHYHANMAMVIKLGEWFDYLRQNDVYDNTKIIIVADHGYFMEQYDKLPKLDNLGENGEYLMQYNPLLMVKDFNAQGFVTDNQFMTNADVPTIAVKDLIENPVNPYTNKPINSDPKSGEQHISCSDSYSVLENNGYKFEKSYWISVKDDIFNLDNWSNYKDAVQ